MSNDRASTASDLTERLSGCFTGIIHDTMRTMGLRDFVLPHDIRPLARGPRLAGPVTTVLGRIQPGADRHETFLKWTECLGSARPGHVLVCQASDQVVSHMGELSGETLMQRGVRGFITDGGCRDVEPLLELGFPVCCRYFTPRDLAGYWFADALDVPITIGTVRIHPGDYVLADWDGICILPAQHAAAIVTAAETAMRAENGVRDAIRAGVHPQQAYLQHRVF